MNYKLYTINVRTMDDSSHCDPRENSNHGRMCISPHRQYDFPCELDIDRENFDDSLLNEYHIIRLDCYIHSWVTFSLYWEWTQCRFDTSTRCWFMAVPKELNSYDYEVRSESNNKDQWEKVMYTYEEAKELTRQEINTYNQRASWEIYEYEIEELEEFVWWFRSEEEALTEAKCSVDFQAQSDLRNHMKQLKSWIKSKTPLIYRTPLSSH